jgi:hypothetical protein
MAQIKNLPWPDLYRQPDRVKRLTHMTGNGDELVRLRGIYFQFLIIFY